MVFNPFIFSNPMNIGFNWGLNTGLDWFGLDVVQTDNPNAPSYREVTTGSFNSFLGGLSITTLIIIGVGAYLLLRR